MASTRQWQLLLIYTSICLWSLALFFGSLSVINSELMRSLVGHPKITVFSPELDTCTWAASTFLAFSALLLTGLRIIRCIGLAVAGSLMLLSAQPWVTGNLVPSGLLPVLEFFGVGFILAATLLQLRSFVTGLDRKSLLPRATATGLFFAYLFALLLPIEFWALFGWTLVPTFKFGVTPEGARLDLYLSRIAHPIVPWLLLAVLLGWLVHLWPGPSVSKTISEDALLRRVASWARLGILGPRRFSNLLVKLRSSPSEEGHFDYALMLFGLSASWIVAGFIAYYPYLAGASGLVGQDITEPVIGYYDSLVSVNRGGFVASLFSNERVRSSPVYYFLLYIAQAVSFQSPFVVLKFAPAATLLAVASLVYYLVWVGSRDVRLSALSAVLTVPSFATIVGLYTGILSNWLAFGLTALFLGLFLKATEKRSRAYGLAATVVSIAIALTHIWMYAFLLAVVLCFTAMAYMRRDADRRLEVGFGAMIITVGIIGYAVASAMTGAALFRPGQLLQSMILRSVQIETLFAFWDAIIQLYRLRFFANFLILILAVVGILIITPTIRFHRLLISWMVVTSMGAILISPTGLVVPGTNTLSESFLWRVLFIAPFPILTALGLNAAMNAIRTLSGACRSSGTAQAWKGQREGFSTSLHYAVSLMLLNAAVVAALLSAGAPTTLTLLAINCFVVTILLLAFKTDYVRLSQALFSVLVVTSLVNYCLLSVLSLTR